jgi:two-component system alkaline phosphatase synthesis response regulator PhoP
MDKKKAVLCDDDKTTMLIMKHLLGKIGFSVSVAGNGGDGLALLNSEKPQLLVLDLDMPVKNGMEVLKTMQKVHGASPYVIVLSAQENPKDRDQVHSLGAEEMIVKPFKPAELVGKIEALMKEGKI